MTMMCFAPFATAESHRTAVQRASTGLSVRGVARGSTVTVHLAKIWLTQNTFAKSAVTRTRPWSFMLLVGHLLVYLATFFCI